MAVKRYFASKDSTITNAFMDDLTTRATGSNMGASDILEVFSIVGQASFTDKGQTTGSVELSRVLIQFPIEDITADRTATSIPASGSVSFYLRMFNARHSQTTPRDIALEIVPLNQSWQEGTGLDMDTYTDLVHGNPGATWVSASNSEAWTVPGGDFYTSSFGDGPTGSAGHIAEFKVGNEDLEIDITELVEEWIQGEEISNYGALIKLIGSQEGFFSSSAATQDNDGATTTVTPDFIDSVPINLSGATTSYYTKKFFGRGSEFYFKRPHIEARWDSSIRDDRGSFYFSSSLATGEDNMNTLYLYNFVRGRLRNIPSVDDSNIYVSLFLASASSNEPSGSAIQQSTVEVDDICTGLSPATGGWVSTGIYSCSVCVTAGTTADTKLLDVWHSADLKSDSNETYFTGTIYPKSLESYSYNYNSTYVTSITNLRPSYSTRETARFRVYIREKDWSPTIYSKASQEVETTTIESGSYRIFRVADDLEVIAHNTGSDLATLLSYDVTGNYFDLEMSLLQEDYAYGIGFAYYDASIDDWVEQKETFKFRVD